MPKKELSHYQVVRCPECNKEIAIILGMPEAIDLKEFQKRSREQVKAWKEEEKAKRKAKP